jgi:hypothetical protein
MVAMAKKNLLDEAAGSLKEARRLVIEHLQQPENKITSASADSVIRLLDLTRKIENLRCELEVHSRISNGG